ncbi:MAG: hypothetical protein HKN07_10990 [Acidimicrobiia bacterium]|nr:hypothetical protein [Acidimicrobiia bacterium]
MTVRRLLAVIVVTLAVAAGACSQETAEPIVFGEGSIPSTVPSDFPIPDQASIGSTLVDAVNGRTEVSMIVPASVEESAQFFVVNMLPGGFVIDSSSGDAARWTISFRRDDLTGEIILQALSEGTSQAVVTLTQ